jgi:hypothetical protein
MSVAPRCSALVTHAATLALLVAVSQSAGAQSGSGSVAFTFTGFAGPMALAQEADQNNSLRWSSTGLVNEVRPEVVGWAPRGSSPGDGGWVLGAQPFSPTAPLTSVRLRQTSAAPGTPDENVISFAPRDFTNVAQGEDFVLGTLTFQNGSWFGAGFTPPLNTPTDLFFSLATTSPDGAAYNQTIAGAIRMVVNGPLIIDNSTPAGQEAQADWVHVIGPAVLGSMGAFRVFDFFARPAGATGTGTVDIVARFNSLDLVGLANPRGGFTTPGVEPLPPEGPGTVVPEPSTWILLATGGAALLVGRRALRRRG